jgi:hypothetical protein
VQITKESFSFKFTQFFSLAIISLIILSLIVCGLGYFFYWRSTQTHHINFEEMVNALKEDSLKGNHSEIVSFPDSIQESYNTMLERTWTKEIPQIIDKRFPKLDNNTKGNMNDWINETGLPKEVKIDFINNFADLVDEMKKKHVEINNFSDFMDLYQSVKYGYYSAENSPYKPFLSSLTPTTLIMIFFLILGVVGLYSLILVLLRIERNTRPKKEI